MTGDRRTRGGLVRGPMSAVIATSLFGLQTACIGGQTGTTPVTRAETDSYHLPIMRWKAHALRQSETEKKRDKFRTCCLRPLERIAHPGSSLAGRP